jgi:hypothetical protein
MSWIRCSGSSFACAALGCDRAGDVNQACMGAVMGGVSCSPFSPRVSARARQAYDVVLGGMDCVCVCVCLCFCLCSHIAEGCM